MDGTVQHVIWPVQPCKAISSGHTSGLACIADLNGERHCGILSEQSPCMQLTEPAGIEPLGILWRVSSYRECFASA